jgi:hypothetical protein
MFFLSFQLNNILDVVFAKTKDFAPLALGKIRDNCTPQSPEHQGKPDPTDIHGVGANRTELAKARL